MSEVPPTYRMNAPEGGPPPTNKPSRVWLWVLLGFIGVCGVCGVVGAAILVPVFAQARIAARLSVSNNQAKMVSVAVLSYAADFDDHMPPLENSSKTPDLIAKYFDQSGTTSRRRYSADALKAKAATYKWNLAASKIDLGAVSNAQNVWMFYDDDAENKKISMAYLDSHVASIMRENLSAQTSAKLMIDKKNK